MAPLNFVASLPWLRSCAQLCRFAVVHSASSPLRSLPQPTENPIEKPCSALNLCGLEKKGRFRMVIDINAQLLVTSSPGGSLLFLRSRSFSLLCGDVILLRIVCQPLLVTGGFALCWWPSFETSFIVTLTRNCVDDRDCGHGKQRQGSFLA